MKLSYGVDVSAFQRITDWRAVARVCAFVIVKATEGHSYVSDAFGPYSAAARAAGLVVGSYHIAKPPGSAGAEARWYASRLRAAGWRDGYDLPPALDIEGSGGLGRTQLTAWCRAFVTILDAELGLTNHPPMRRTGFYIGGSLAHMVDVPAIVRDRWYWGTPHYYLKPTWPTTIPAGMAVYQFADHGIGAVPGITGNALDLDVSDPATLRAMAPNHYRPTPTTPEVTEVTADEVRAIVRAEVDAGMRRWLTVPTTAEQRDRYHYAHETYRMGSLVNDASWHARLAVQMLYTLAHQLAPHLAGDVDVRQVAEATDDTEEFSASSTSAATLEHGSTGNLPAGA